MILRIVIGIIVLYLLFKLIKEWKALKGSSKANLPAAGEDLVEDPLCHTYIPVSRACRVSIDGETVYFCSQKCLERYSRERKT